MDPPPEPADERLDGVFEWEDHQGDYHTNHARVVMVWDSKLRHHRGARKARLSRVERAVKAYVQKWGQGACTGCITCIERSDTMRGVVVCSCGAGWWYCRYIGRELKGTGKL